MARRKVQVEPARNPGSEVLVAADNAAQASRAGDYAFMIHLRKRSGVVGAVLCDNVLVTSRLLDKHLDILAPLDHPAMCNACLQERDKQQATHRAGRGQVSATRGGLMMPAPPPVFQPVMVAR